MEKNLLALVEQAGVVGAGGAGFPTHIKLKAQADTVIINGAECEPLLRVDQQLMAGQAPQLLAALSLMVEQVGAKAGIIALKQKYQAAISALTEFLPQYPKLSLHQLGNFYPAGDEQVLVYEVLGRIVPEGGIPLLVGAVVVNVETALNVYRAYSEEAPVTDTYVTLAGAVRAPKTVLAPLGITVGEVLQLAGGPILPDYQIIDGGPMMGDTVTPEHLIGKTTKGLIVLPAGHPLLLSLNKQLSRTLKEACVACMQCSLCTMVCPRGLLGHKLAPHKLMRLTAYGRLCEFGQTPLSAYLCCGCRLCEYACVMGLQPWKLNNSLKEALDAQGQKNNLHNKPEKTDPFREFLRYPVNKLIMQLGLVAYDVPAPLEYKRHVFNKVTIPLKQHSGAPALPIVQAGDIVARGDLIARIPDGLISANIHASISGRVNAVTAESINIESI